MGPAEGVLLLAGATLVTIGVSFHCSMFFRWDGGGPADGVIFRGGGPPKAGGGAP